MKEPNPRHHLAGLAVDGWRVKPCVPPTLLHKLSRIVDIGVDVRGSVGADELLHFLDLHPLRLMRNAVSVDHSDRGDESAGREIGVCFAKDCGNVDMVDRLKGKRLDLVAVKEAVEGSQSLAGISGRTVKLS